MLQSFNIFLIQLAGLIILAILSYQDIKTMTVDTRLNFLMFGLIAGFTIQINIVFFLLVMAAMIILYFFINLVRYFNDFGEADPEILAWSLALILINNVSGEVQSYIFAGSLAIILLLSLVKYRNQRIPFVPAIALSYLVSFIYLLFSL